MKCPVCKYNNSLYMLFCPQCGWDYKEDLSEDYAKLYQKKRELHTQFYLRIQQNKIQSEKLKSDINYQQESITQQQNRKKENEQKSNQLQQEIDEINEVIQKKEALISEYQNYQNKINKTDRLLKSYHYTRERIDCKIKNREIYIQNPYSNEFPNLMLVLGKKRMGKRTQNALYFINLSQFIQPIGQRRWKCMIPNNYGLKGKFFGFVISTHKNSEQQVDVECEEAVINF